MNTDLLLPYLVVLFCVNVGLVLYSNLRVRKRRRDEPTLVAPESVDVTTAAGVQVE